MANPQTYKRIPALRFPEFQNDGEWEVKRLGEIVTVNSGRDYKHLNPGNIPVYGTGGYMLSVDDKLSNVDAIGIGRKGTIDKPQYLKAPFWTVDTLFFLTANAGYDLRFVFCLLQTIEWKKYSEQTGVPSLTRTSIEKIEVKVPPLAEQKRIAECLSSMDEMIVECNNKLELLKSHKQGLMQQLFAPLNGGGKSLIPRLRFPEFINTKEWEIKKLGEIGDVCMCKRILKSETNLTGSVPFYKIGTFGKEADAFIPEDLFYEYKKKYSYPTKGDILFSAAGTIGRYVVFDGKPAYFQDSNIVWIANDESIVFNSFLKYIYSLAEWQVDDGGVVKRLYNDSIRKTTIPIPTLPEQRKIADCLSSLDETIRLYNDKLTMLRHHKRGLMQQLFPQA